MDLSAHGPGATVRAWLVCSRIPSGAEGANTLGVERIQVVAIEPQALVLQAARQASSGHREGPREVLSMANGPDSLTAQEGLRP